jgi:hypothetical protein
MANPDDQRTRRTRSQLLVAGWVLLVVSLLLALVGPRLTRSDLPADISTRMGNMDWLSLGWILAGMITGAIALMCFAAGWVLRSRASDGAHQPKATQSK